MAEVARSIVDIEPGRIAIVPGLRDEHDGVPDVMRGEEVQIFGAMALTGIADGLFVLPGTHNKWATVQGGRVTGFRTFMTGEFYALLSQQSILARTLDADGAARRGRLPARAWRRPTTATGLLHNAFGARTLALFDRMPAAELASYLSGLLIGEELRTQSLHAGRRRGADRRAGADRSATRSRCARSRHRSRARSAPKPPGPGCTRCRTCPSQRP